MEAAGLKSWGCVALLALATGCFSPSPEALRSLEEVKAQGDALSHAADAVEDRLLANQDKVHLWQELGRRHQQVSEVALANHSEHMESMVRLIVAQQEKQHKQRRGRAVAEAEVEVAYSSPSLTKKRHKRHD